MKLSFYRVEMLSPSFEYKLAPQLHFNFPTLRIQICPFSSLVQLPLMKCKISSEEKPKNHQMKVWTLCYPLKILVFYSLTKMGKCKKFALYTRHGHFSMDIKTLLQSCSLYNHLNHSMIPNLVTAVHKFLKPDVSLRFSRVCSEWPEPNHYDWWG